MKHFEVVALRTERPLTSPAALAFAPGFEIGGNVICATNAALGLLGQIGPAHALKRSCDVLDDEEYFQNYTPGLRE